MKNSIVLCCTSTGSSDLSLGDIERLHEEKGYRLSPEGYCRFHYVIYRNGEVHVGRSEDLIGWHLNRYDQNCLIVACVGDEDNITDEQLSSLDELVANLKFEHPYASIKDASETRIGEKGVLKYAVA